MSNVDLNTSGAHGGYGAWLQLFRVSNLPTAAGNVLAAYLLVLGSWQPVWQLALAVLVSCLLYAAGVVLNDVYDLAVDRRQRPERPIPSGRISLRSARRVGYGLLALGWCIATASAFSPLATGELNWQLIAIATLLASMIVAYDRWLKRLPLGPPAMGACRGLNVLLGAAFAWNSFDIQRHPAVGIAHPLIPYAIGLAIYVAGVTWLARREATASVRGQLAGALVVMAAGTGLLAALSLWSSEWAPMGPRRAGLIANFHWLVILLAAPALLRAFAAIVNPRPALVQRAVIVGLTTMLFFDAAIALWAVPDRPVYALLIAALLIPALLLRAVSRPT